MIIKARRNFSLKLLKEYEDEVLSLYKQSSPDFRFIEVEGTHHVHLGAAHIVAPHICNFLNPLKAKL